MKKSIKIAVTVIAAIFVLLLALPYAFKGKIKELAISEGNKLLNAEFYFDDVDISLLRNFPKATLSLEDFWIKGVGDFENDTLLDAGEISVSVNLMSLLGNSGYEITKVEVNDTKVKAIVLSDGRANWDVMKTDTTATAETDTTATESSFRIKLQKLALTDVDITYDDQQSNMYASVDGLELTCSGDMSAEHTVLKLESDIKALLFRMNDIPFLKDAGIAATVNVDADLQNRKFTLQENKLRLNAIEANLDGWVALADSTTQMDLKMNTSEIQFKEILSLVPAIYMKDFESLQTSGKVSMEAWAKGTMDAENLPAMEVKLKVEDGQFRYPALPAGVDKIEVTAEVSNPGGSADLTEVKIDPFSFTMAGNDFAATATVKTPVSDPDFRFSANGVLNLGKIKEIYPLEDMSLNGVVTAAMSVAGKLSYVEKEQYDKIAAQGTLKLNDMDLDMKDMPKIGIKQSVFTFTPQYLNLSETTVNIGNNDLTADCRFENYMAFALKGKTLKGRVNASSNHFNLNDFMTTTDSTMVAAADTTQTASATEAMGVIRVPDNIDFSMNVNMKEVLFDKMTLKDLNGALTVKNSVVDMKNLSMNTMGGKVVMNGSYATPKNQDPDLKAAFSMTGLSFTQTFKELDMIQKFAPVFEGMEGNFSGKMNLTAALDSTMSPVLNTLQADGQLQTKDINLSNVKCIGQIAELVNKPSLKSLSAKDLTLDFTIKEGRLSTKPFDIKLGDTTINLSGDTGLDQTVNYSGKIKLPASTGTISQLTTVDLKIGGTLTAPKVTIDTKSMANQAVQSVTNKALEKAAQKLGLDSTVTSNADSLKQKVKEKVTEKAVNKVLNLLKKK